MKITASLVIPLFNNDKTLISQLKKCEAIMKKICDKYEIIICEDKSKDNSANLLKRHFLHKKNFSIIFNKNNLGIAKTIKKLYRKAKYPYVILFSVDGDWDPNDIKKMLISMEKNNADIILGKRKYIQYSFYRKFVSFFYNFLPLLFFQVKTVDAGSIKVIKREIIRSTTLISTSVFFEAELIIRSAKQGKTIVAIPVSFKKKKESKGLGGKFSLVISSFVDLIKLRLKI